MKREKEGEKRRERSGEERQRAASSEQRGKSSLNILIIIPLPSLSGFSYNLFYWINCCGIGHFQWGDAALIFHVLCVSAL